MRFNNLNDWLAWQESLNPKKIDLGLERVSRVLVQAGMSSSFDCPLITVAGTNGKGSVAAMLEAMAIAAGLKVCCYTSPHIFNYNERIKINGQPIDDDALCAAFESIDRARGDIQLTYFEFGTLAAIDLFFKQQPDLVVLEVGLGGRLDAVNIMDSDVSVLTSVAIDHIEWLGDNRESIGYEKSGVFRSGKPVICGEPDVPDSVVQRAQELHCEFIRIGRDYAVNINHENAQWHLKSYYSDLTDLPAPCLSGKFQYVNAATAILALQALQAKKLLTAWQAKKTFKKVIATALKQIKLPGRFQPIHTKPLVYVDVAHNLQAAQALASQLNASANTGLKTWAIVAMLSDKDIKGVIESVSVEVDYWCFAGLENTSRGLSLQGLVDNLPDDFIMAANQKNQCKILSDTELSAKSVQQACSLVILKANKNDRIIVFGSFYTVAEAMRFFSGIDVNVGEKL